MRLLAMLPTAVDVWSRSLVLVEVWSRSRTVEVTSFWLRVSR
jgi:hypothetical protein